jgi:spermidine synthase
VYAVLEAGIAVLGLLVLVIVPLVGGAYTSTNVHGLAGILLRGLVCAICLLPPTLLMGATLPAIARWVETTPTGVSWLGFFYGSNIAGRRLWVSSRRFLSASRSRHGDDDCRRRLSSTSVLRPPGTRCRNAPHTDPAVQPPAKALRNRSASHGPISCISRSPCPGLSALGAEVVWTRLLSLMLGASVYTFSIILAVFLIGLGFGSSAGSVLARANRARARSDGASCGSVRRSRGRRS